MKRLLFGGAALAVWLLPALALAQTGPSMEVVDLNTSRYDQNGQTTLVVEFRNLTSPLDPALLSLTTNGLPVQGFEVEPLAQSQEPVLIALVIDTSGSMLGPPMEAAKAAARGFIEAKRPGDFIALVTFADTVQTLSPFTSDVAALTA
ncbi:MAG: vWA domain-containing protein, partial [Actinomycetota bacterium]